MQSKINPFELSRLLEDHLNATRSQTSSKQVPPSACELSNSESDISLPFKENSAEISFQIPNIHDFCLFLRNRAVEELKWSDFRSEIRKILLEVLNGLRSSFDTIMDNLAKQIEPILLPNDDAIEFFESFSDGYLSNSPELLAKNLKLFNEMRQNPKAVSQFSEPSERNLKIAMEQLNCLFNALSLSLNDFEKKATCLGSAISAETPKKYFPIVSDPSQFSRKSTNCFGYHLVACHPSKNYYAASQAESQKVFIHSLVDERLVDEIKLDAGIPEGKYQKEFKGRGVTSDTLKWSGNGLFLLSGSSLSGFIHLIKFQESSLLPLDFERAQRIADLDGLKLISFSHESEFIVSDFVSRVSLLDARRFLDGNNHPAVISSSISPKVNGEPSNESGLVSLVSLAPFNFSKITTMELEKCKEHLFVAEASGGISIIELKGSRVLARKNHWRNVSNGRDHVSVAQFSKCQNFIAVGGDYFIQVLNRNLENLTEVSLGTRVLDISWVFVQKGLQVIVLGALRAIGAVYSDDSGRDGKLVVTKEIGDEYMKGMSVSETTGDLVVVGIGKSQWRLRVN